ncbi:antiviral RADAR system adenosine triphosphatase RdrA [Pseudoalteromonas luteoviolacea]|uniref:antiviral RADAR system adenosine triphosphatase RdrA n=1 Tax=Pseudoalteromonas luteoviolacea TaxID=43657 RepID=UPI001B376824|nr:antiviral RADAR system adenosine triphosphatase RdrA [Pseudoalteromonas luteoviolacea]MBQ4837357.1 hypothetical protein [Pseudoalteromonas luteoviolacea]
MATTYLLDLTKEEYRDDFVSLNEEQGKQHKEFWQYEARDKLVDKLKSFVKDAIAYKSERKNNKHKTWLSHNSILINGARGTGKTVFLRNCEAMWQAHCKQNSDDVAGSIHFLPAIDPTMLVDHDNFANVIITQIYTEVDKVLNNTDCCLSSGNIGEESKQQFYKRLQKLADSLGKKEEFEGCNGIDKILQYKSGINIESRFHDYVEAALNLLGSSAIALPIDDVDMALERAYEVVDEVRRLLGCPYIIPIVSGDYSLYEQMVNVHFDEKAYRDKTYDKALKDKGIVIAKELTNAYLTKVFPNHMRITLLPVHYIYPTLTFKIEDKKGDDSLVTYSHYENYLLEHFYPLCKNEEVLKGWPEPKSAREFTLLARTIHPDELIKANQDKELNNNALWKGYLNWADLKQEGLAYCNTDSYLTLKNRDKEEPFNILDLPCFNPLKQAEMAKDYTKWANKPLLSSQLISLGFSGKITSSELKKDDSKSEWQIQNTALLEQAFSFDDRSLSSLPPIEVYHEKSTVTKKVKISKDRDFKIFTTVDEEGNIDKTVESEIYCSLDELLISVFVQTHAYSKLKNDYQFVFMSRAFEIIAYSFLTAQQDKKEVNSIKGILGRRPFYCIFNTSPTKAIEDKELADSDEVQIDEEDFDELDRRKRVSEVLCAEIGKWRKDHAKLFEQLAIEKLIPIFSYMFNKTFTAFNSFRVNNYFKSTFTDEYLTDHVKRFEYMLLNAACTAMIDGEAVTANVAITDKQETIRNPEKFRKVDRTLTSNRAILEGENSDPNSPQRLFIKALETHPLFVVIREKADKNDQNPSVESSIIASIRLSKNKVGDQEGKGRTTPKKSTSTVKLPTSVKTKLKGYLEANYLFYSKKSNLNQIQEALLEDITVNEEGVRNFYLNITYNLDNKHEINNSRGPSRELNLFKAMYREFEDK